MIRYELAEVVDGDDAAGERVEVPLGFVELFLEPFVKTAVVWKLTKLIVQGGVADLLLRKLHVVVCAFDPEHVLDACNELFVLERFCDELVRAGSRCL